MKILPSFLGLILYLSMSSVTLDTAVGYSVLKDVDAMEDLALIMDAAERLQDLQLLAKEMDGTIVTIVQLQLLLYIVHASQVYSAASCFDFILFLLCFSVSVKCINKEGWSQSLTLARLKKMITLFTRVGYTPSVTLIFAPECSELKKEKKSYKGLVYESGKGQHAEDNMIKDCGRPDKFYLTSSPCPDCAMKLMTEYSRSRDKPTIYVGHPYIGGGKSKIGPGSKNANKVCLAMLVQKGFKLLPWNWIEFRSYVDNDMCEAVINELYKSPIADEFNKQLKGTTESLVDVTKMVNANPRYNFEADCRKALGK